MNRILILLLVLIVSLPCFGDTHTYYVSQNGNNANAGGSEAPWATLLYAINNHTASSGETVEIYVDNNLTTVSAPLIFSDASSKHNGINFRIEPNSAGPSPITYYDVNFGAAVYPHAIGFTGVTSGSITINGMHFILRDTDGYGSIDVNYATDNGMSINLNNCDFNVTPSTISGSFLSMQADAGSAATRDINIVNTTINAQSTGLGLKRAGAVTVKNSTIATKNVNGTAVSIGGNLASLVVSGSNIIGGVTGGDAIVQTAGTFTTGYLRLTNDYITAGRAGVYFYDGVGQAYMRDCNVSSYTTTTFGAVQFGEDAATDVGTGFGQLEISDNNILSVACGALWVSYGADGAVIRGNKTKGETHSVRLISSYDQFSFNLCRGTLPLFVVGDYQIINNNTVCEDSVVTSTSTAFLVGVPAGASYNGWPFPHNNKIYNNIFVTTGTGSASYAYWDYDGWGGANNNHRGLNLEATSALVPSRRNNETDLMADYHDYNIYWNTNAASRANGKIARLGAYGVSAADCNTIADMQAIWAVYNLQYGTTNDSHSLVANPVFVDATNGDFRLMSNSPAINAGKPLINGGKTTMGAYQFPVSSFLTRQ